jgi:hypothetical protein
MRLTRHGALHNRNGIARLRRRGQSISQQLTKGAFADRNAISVGQLRVRINANEKKQSNKFHESRVRKVKEENNHS